MMDKAGENARRAADMAQPSGQTMSAVVGADLGRLRCNGDGHRELPREHWRKRAIAGCSTR